MTAEIAILNPHGVALAADSAVTIGNQKIINSAIKLFSLSKTNPVGIMVYGNATLLGMPWETLIKFYRKKSLNKNFNSLEEYGSDFIDFINENIMLFSEPLQQNWFQTELATLLEVILNDSNKLKEKHDANTSSTEKEFSIFFDEALDIALDFLGQSSETCSTIDFTKPETKERIKSDSYIIINDFKENNELNQMADEKFIKLAILIVKNHLSSQTNAGVVISGFGEDEIYPSIITYDISGIYLNKLIYKIQKDKTFFNKNGHEPISQIMAFAQEDVVVSFLKGVNSDVRNFITKTFLCTRQK